MSWVKFGESLESIKIDLETLIDLSEDNIINIYCKKCKKHTHHDVFRWLVTGLPKSECVENNKGEWIEMQVPEFADACIIQCNKCGEMSIARWKPDE